jgi:dTMP kinase
MGGHQFHSPHDASVAPPPVRGRLVVVEGPTGVGRSTHIALLREWLERTGHAVIETGMSGSALAGKGLTKAKEGHTLGGLTMSLFYATDFADRIEHEVMPALRAGFIVLTDRYTYSLMARAIVRGADPDWMAHIYDFAPTPDLVIYLRTSVNEMITRIVHTSGLTYWESGMDLHLGDDLFDSFVEYQGRLLAALDTMAGEHAFEMVDTSASVEEVADRLKALVTPLLLQT